MTFEGTNIELRVYGKSQFAGILGVSGETLRKYLREVRPALEQLEGYSKLAKTIRPSEARLVLIHIGIMPKDSTIPLETQVE